MARWPDTPDSHPDDTAFQRFFPKVDWACGLWTQRTGERGDLGIADAWDRIRKSYDRYRKGEPLDSSDLFLSIRRFPYILEKDPFSSPQVPRSEAAGEQLRYHAPFLGAVGSRGLVLALTVPANAGVDEPRRFLAHYGEEAAVLVGGRTCNWAFRVPKDDTDSDPGSKKRRFTTVPVTLSTSPNDKRAGGSQRTVWFRSETPHAVANPDHEQDAKLLLFFSDPQGPHRIVQTSPLPLEKGLGTHHLADSSDDEEHWKSLTSIGPRIRYWRGRRGLSVLELGQLATMQPSAISRIESGTGRLPTFQQVVRLAFALDVAPQELVPDDSVSHIEGCYLHRRDDVAEYLDSALSRSHGNAKLAWEPVLGPRGKLRIQVPYEWRDVPGADGSGLCILLCSSPRARSLTLFNLYIGGGWGEPMRDAIGSLNAKGISDNARWSSYAGDLCLYVVEGEITVEMRPYTDGHLFPKIMQRYQNELDGDVKQIKLGLGNLLLLNPNYAHRFRMASNSARCKLLCALWRNDGLSHAISLPDFDAFTRINELASKYVK